MQISTINVQPALWLSCKVFFLLFYLDLSFSLLIDVPYPVTKLGFKEGCSYINLTWSQPSSDGEGGNVTGYLVQMKLASSEEPWMNWTTNYVAQSTQSCLFTQLRPNSEYHVTIMAQNKMGYGWPSVKNVSTIHAGNFSRKFACLNQFNLEFLFDLLTVGQRIPIPPSLPNFTSNLQGLCLVSCERLLRPLQSQRKLS